MFAHLLALTTTTLGALAYQKPALEYAFTITSYNQAIGSPIPLGQNLETVGTGVNSTISGPLLNATLVSLTFREQTYNSTESGAPSYSASQASALYITADGQVVDYQQSGTAASNGQVQSLMLNVGGQYAYLSQYVFACYTPAVSGANLPANGTSSGMMSRADAVTSPKTPSSAQGPPTKGSADCFVVGGM